MWSFNIRYLLLLFMCVISNLNYTCAQDVSASINTKKSLNIVDNRFISVVIDPLILISGLNISLPTLNLAKHFSPAFIRIQGFSTPQIIYSDEVRNNKDNFSGLKLTVTSSMWTSLNEWLISANLTPVFALSDRDRVNDAWNPKSAALPLMVMADKMNMTCFWELSNDTPNESLKQYADDITSLRHILDVFPASRRSWGIVGGELGQHPLALLPAEGAETAQRLLKTIESTVDAVVWSPILNNKSQYPAKVRRGILPNTKKGPAIWTTAPRNENPSNFEDALIWAKNLGQSAARGYSVIFRQPKINELFELTPAYWVSYFHKNLMGRNVLDIRSINYNNKNNAYIFAHCTKNQTNNTKKGGITVFIVNMENEAINITTKLLGINLKDLDVQSYVLTSLDEDNSKIYLNGELLTISDLQDNKFEFMPKCNNINASKSLLLDAPPKSVGFYVIPNANVPTCCCNEHNQHESIESQYENISENDSEKEAKKIANMDALAKVIENELLSYEEYIKNPAEWRRLLHSQTSDPINRNANEFPEDVRRVIIERAKQKKILELEEKSKHIKHLLIERARNEETKAKLLSDIEKLKANEVEQAIDELINKNNEENKLREKRSLVTSNEDLSWMQHEENMNAVPRPTRRTQNNLDERISLDPIYENEQESACACRRTGKCNCGKNYTNMFLKQMLQVLNSDQKQVENRIENYEGSNQNNKFEEIKEMKSLVNELKSIVTTMKYLDTQNKTNYNKQQKEEIEDSNANEYIKVNLIPKDRLKRNTEENNNDFLEEPTNSVSKKRNLIRKKRVPLLMKELKQLENEIMKVNTTMKPEEARTETTKPKEERIEPAKPKEEKIEEIKEKVENDQHHNTKYKLLQRKLVHQEKLENQIEHYLQKIRQSKADLQNELEKSLTIKQFGAHVKKHVKREIGDSDDDEMIDNNETNKFIENNALDSDEQTKETEIFLNEISKEGKNLPNFVKENEEATYKLKVKAFPKKRINKIIKMFENESKQNNVDIVKPKRKVIITTSSTMKPIAKENKTEVFHDARDDNTNTTSKTEQANEDGFVDEAFKTLSQCLSEFHRKIVDFLRFLSP